MQCWKLWRRSSYYLRYPRFRRRCRHLLFLHNDRFRWGRSLRLFGCFKLHYTQSCMHKQLQIMHLRQLQQLQPRLRPPGVCCFHPLCCSSHAVLRTLSSGMIATSPVLCCERVRAQHAVVVFGLPKLKSHSKVNADHAFFSVFDGVIVFLLHPVNICISTQVAIQMNNACMLRLAPCPVRLRPLDKHDCLETRHVSAK